MSRRRVFVDASVVRGVSVGHRTDECDTRVVVNRAGETIPRRSTHVSPSNSITLGSID